MKIPEIYSHSNEYTINEPSNGHSSQVTSSNEKVLLDLQKIIHLYLNQKPYRTINRLSKQCKVSEPTLRRIYKGQIKTLPTLTTILDILTNIAGEKNISKIRDAYPGAIADYLDVNLPQAVECETEYNSELNQELNDPTKYIIYKLASNSCGVQLEKIIELFGQHGAQLALDLISKNYLKRKQNCLFATAKHFTSNHKNFKKNFKLIADFIKITSEANMDRNSSLIANYSESLTPEAYKEVISLQKRTLKKIRNIMSTPSNMGSIPTFFLLAIDTLDMLSADLDNKKN